MFCENCGTKLADGDLFCPNCGTKIIQVASAEMEESPTVAEEVVKENLKEDVAELMAEESLSKSVEDIETGAPRIPDVPVAPEVTVVPEVSGTPEADVLTSGSQSQAQQAAYQQAQPQTQQAAYQQAQSQMQQGAYQQSQSGYYQQSAQIPKKPVNKGLIIGIIIAVVALIGIYVGIMMYNNRKTAIDVTEYYTITFDGIEPEGSAYADFDSEKFIADNSKNIRPKKGARGADPEDIAIEFIRDCDLDSYNLDKTEGLSVGDEVVLHVDIDAEKALEMYNVQLTVSDITKKVEGLGYYVSKASQLSDQVLSDMKTTAENDIKACIDSNFSYYATDSAYEFLGTYVLYPKKDSGYTSNRVILVHKYSVAIKDGDWSTVVDAYWYTMFDDVLVDANGTFNYDSSRYSTPQSYGDYYYVQSDTGWWGTYYNVYGCETLNDLYNDQVQSYSDSYDIDNAVTDKAGSLVSGPVSAPKDDEEEPEEEEDTEDAEEEENTAEEGEYEGLLIPDILERKLTKDEIKDMDDDDIQTAINDLSALCGYVFTKKTELNDYYSKFDWYEPQEGNKVNEETLGKTGYKNYEALSKERKKRNSD